MFAVPNHMLGQFSTELLMLYPGANILVAGKEDFESQNRKKLFSRIAVVAQSLLCKPFGINHATGGSK